MTKIIAPLYQHDIISKQLLQERDIVMDISLLPLSSFIDELIIHDDNGYDEKLISTLSNISNKLSVLSTYTNNKTFIQSIKDFHISMHLYNISVDDLKDASTKDKDLKIIFEALQPLVPNEVEKVNKLQQHLMSQPLENTFISTHPKHNNYEHYVTELLLEHGLKHYEPPKYDIKKTVAYYANNMRSEIEASAQLIVDQSLLNAQVILLDASYEPLVKNIYERYNIPSNLSYVDDNDTYSLRMLSVFGLLLLKDEKSVTQFMSSNPFNLQNMSYVSNLHDFFNFDLKSLINYEAQRLEDPILNKYDLEHYDKIVDKSLESMIQLKEILNELMSDDRLSLIENVFNYFLENHYDQRLVSLQQKLLKQKDALLNSDDLYSLLQNILTTNSSALINSDHVVVTTLDQHEYFNKDDVIILGATIKNYPNLNQLSGVIDETYASQTNYPKKTDRFKQQLDTLESIKKGKNVYVFYPLSTNEGKSIEASFSLLNFVKDHGGDNVRFPLIENDYYKTRDYVLDAHLSKKLFFKDNVLSGSITKFEQYNKCPYAFYLKYGLNLRPKSLPSLSYAYLGSVTHLIIERIVTSQINGEAYPTDEEVIHIINESFLALELLNDPKVNIVKLTLIKQLLPVLSFLKKADNDTNFKPIALEQKFYYDINDNMKIYGIIDRIDAYNDYIRIIDYKSSHQSLSGTKLKQGLQLQLITYLMAMTQHGKKAAGAFYISLKTENSTTPAATVKKTKPHYIKNNEQEVYNNYINNNRLEGWHFDIEDNFYFSKDYVKSLTEKNDIVSVSSPYNFETVATIVEHVYQNIYDNISAGMIDCTPVDNPCGFCEYQHICLTTSTNNYRAQIFKDQNLKKEMDIHVD